MSSFKKLSQIIYSNTTFSFTEGPVGKFTYADNFNWAHIEHVLQMEKHIVKSLPESCVDIFCDMRRKDLCYFVLKPGFLGLCSFCQGYNYK